MMNNGGGWIEAVRRARRKTCECLFPRTVFVMWNGFTVEFSLRRGWLFSQWKVLSRPDISSLCSCAPLLGSFGATEHT
jgi:hypothetical protein